MPRVGRILHQSAPHNTTANSIFLQDTIAIAYYPLSAETAQHSNHLRPCFEIVNCLTVPEAVDTKTEFSKTKETARG